MQVEMSLAELLINAITNGRVHGVQFKRSHGERAGDTKQTFDDLNKIIENRLEGARRVAIEQALRKLQEENPRAKLADENRRLKQALYPTDEKADPVYRWCRCCANSWGLNEEPKHSNYCDYVKEVHEFLERTTTAGAADDSAAKDDEVGGR